MKSILYIFICLLVLSCLSRSSKSKKIIPSKANKIKESENVLFSDSLTSYKLEFLNKVPIRILPLTSKSLDTLFEYKEGIYTIDDKVKKGEIDSIFFNIRKQRKNIVENTKNESFYHFYYDYEREYYPIYKINKGNYIVVGTLTFFYNSDIPGVQFELHSFNKDGKHLDYLITYCRFDFEVSYENEFHIDDNFNIKIFKKMIEYFDKDLDDELEEPKVTKRLANYIINEKGIFEKVEDEN